MKYDIYDNSVNESYNWEVAEEQVYLMDVKELEEFLESNDIDPMGYNSLEAMREKATELMFESINNDIPDYYDDEY